jgi:hypothetical protein
MGKPYSSMSTKHLSYKMEWRCSFDKDSLNANWHEMALMKHATPLWKDCAIHRHQEARVVNARGQKWKRYVCRKRGPTAPSAAWSESHQPHVLMQFWTDLKTKIFKRTVYIISAREPTTPCCGSRAKSTEKGAKSVVLEESDNYNFCWVQVQL